MEAKTLMRFKGDEEDAGSFRPQLTSLIDVMTILLVFLIKSFSVEGSLVTPSQDLVLPVSQSKEIAGPAATIEVTKGSVMSDGNVIASISSFAGSDSLVIPNLLVWMRVQKARSPEGSSSREVLIQSDKDTEFNIVKRVMYTCSKAGFSDFSILVVQEG